MKKYLLLVILILIAVMPVFSQAESFFCLCTGFGGGTDVGFQWTILGIQFGAKLVSPFNILLEASGGVAWKESDWGFQFHLGGLIEYRIEEILRLGAGGGMGGGIFLLSGYSYSYPYIRGSVSISFDGGYYKMGLYYDYGFEYGSMFGIRFHFSPGGDL